MTAAIYAQMTILDAIQERISDPEHVAYVLRRVEDEIANLRSDVPDTLKLKEAEPAAEQCRLANFVDFIGAGRGSHALPKALGETERRVDGLTEEVDDFGAVARRSSVRRRSSGSRSDSATSRRSSSSELPVRHRRSGASSSRSA